VLHLHLCIFYRRCCVCCVVVMATRNASILSTILVSEARLADQRRDIEAYVKGIGELQSTSSRHDSNWQDRNKLQTRREKASDLVDDRRVQSV
jgi:hypothetical protein